ncbi:MAG: CHASE2 domain-containing protein [Cyanobacteria bacterium P01_F01_bin.86]
MAIRFSDLLLAQYESRNQEQISPWKLSGVVSLTITTCLILLNSTGLFQILEWAILDQYFHLRPAEEIDSRFLVITVDEPDISEFKQWPLSDEVLAEILTQISQYQPSVIGLDLYRDFPVPSSQETLAAVSQNTPELEEIFKNTPNLIGVEKIGNKSVPPPPILAELDQVAMADVVMDDDGTVRRALLSANVGRELRWALGTAVALYYLEQKGITLETHPSSNKAQLGAVSFPRLKPDGGGYANVDTTGYQILLNFRGPDDAFESVSVTDVWEGRLSAEQVRDRIVLIGSIAPSLNDFVYTPYNTSALTQASQSPGVAIHTHIASQIVSAVLDERSLIRSWPAVVEWGWAFLWCTLGSGIILIPLWYGHNGLTVFVSIGTRILGLSAVLLTLNFLLFLNGWWVPSLPSLIGLATSAVAILTTKNSRLIKDAYIDGLTNVLNRRAFNQKLFEAQKTVEELAIVLCDIDYFKDFNDFYGHPAGDECLRQVAKSIQQAVRSQDLVARYGGEEFAVILQDVSQEKAREIAERMRQKVESCQISHEASQVSPYVTISCGVATRSAGNNSPLAQILIQADQALYRAKRSGRNRVMFLRNSDSASSNQG